MSRPGQNALEARLEALTAEFVRSLVDAMRSASFSDVAGLPSGALSASSPARHTGGARNKPSTSTSPRKAGGRARRSAGDLAEISDRILRTLKKADEPIGLKALSAELGVGPAALTKPLLDLRSSGRIKKHGDKRATTYSAA